MTGRLSVALPCALEMHVIAALDAERDAIARAGGSTSSDQGPSATTTAAAAIGPSLVRTCQPLRAGASVRASPCRKRPPRSSNSLA